MQPAACTTRFIATDHRRGFRQTKASFGLGDFLEHARLVTRCDRALTRRLTRPVVQPSFQVFSRRAKATNRTRAGVVSGSLWVTVVSMGFLLHGEKVYGD